MVQLERTFVMIKPDGVQRGIVGDIVSRFERRGLKIVGMRMLVVSDDLAKQHYAEHSAKPFFPSLVGFIRSGPVVAMVVEGKDVVTVVRSMVGKTKPAESAPGTIRGDFALDTGRNVIHASIRRNRQRKYPCTSINTVSSLLRIDEQWLYEGEVKTGYAANRRCLTEKNLRTPIVCVEARSREDIASGQNPRHDCGQQGGGRHHTAHRGHRSAAVHHTDTL
jgi:nucleoside-diphosphate kinase